jgi:peptidoglycan/LPS O-acetylase OafA/YrhL
LERHNNFDLLRLLAALSVIFSHAFLLAEHSQDHDPLMIVTGGQAILGVAGVFVFFTISGYLISQSFETTPSGFVFLAKRGLRIFPGLFGCLLVCVFVIGPIVTTLPLSEYLARPETWLYLLRNAVLDTDYNRLPGVEFWPGTVGGVVNGPLWSLPCEALLYLMLFGLGACRMLTLPVSLALLVAGIVCLHLDLVDNSFGSALWLLSFFAAGMGLYRLRHLGPRLFARRWIVLAAVGLALSIPAGLFLTAFPLFGSYLVIYLALNRRLPVLRAARFGDLSYGLYIYGWPVEQCVVYATGETAPWWGVFGIAAPVSAALAFLSWHLIEKRCRWHNRATRRPALVPAAAPGD